MNTFLIILGVVTLAAGVLIYRQRSNKIADSDNVLSPNVVKKANEKVQVTKQETSLEVNQIVEELDVLKKKTKSQLVDYAAEKGVKLSSRLKKADLVNEVYKLK